MTPQRQTAIDQLKKLGWTGENDPSYNFPSLDYTSMGDVIETDFLDSTVGATIFDDGRVEYYECWTGGVTTIATGPDDERMTPDQAKTSLLRALVEQIGPLGV